MHKAACGVTIKTATNHGVRGHISNCVFLIAVSSMQMHFKKNIHLHIC